MSELLLIDWDDQQARLLTGSTSGGSLRVHHFASAPIEGEASPSSIASALKPLLADAHHGKARTVFVLGGRDVQSRLLRVPPVPANEMPDLVRLRAGTDFPTVDEAAVIDYLPFESTAAGPTSVLAARVAASTLAGAREVASKLQLTPESITMRGCGVAALAKVVGNHPQEGIGLIVVRRGDALDLIGTQDGNAAVVRTVPLPANVDTDAVASTAAREMRRTIAAFSSELGAHDVESITWIVGDEADNRVAEECSRELSRRVTQVELAKLVSSDTTWPDGSAALAGMVGTGVALANRSLPIDFLAPRKPTEKKTPKTTYALAASLAAITLLGGGWMSYSIVASVEKDAAADIGERETIDADIEKLSKEVRESQDVEQWLATDVNWLDEIDRITLTLRPEPLDNHEAFQPDRDVRLSSLVTKKAAGKRGVGGTVELAGGVRDDAVLEDMENQLRGPGRQVNPKSMINDSQDAPYVWTFQGEIVVTPDSKDRR